MTSFDDSNKKTSDLPTLDEAVPEKYRYDRSSVNRQLKALSQISGVRTIEAVGVQWLVVAVSIWGALYVDRWYVYALSLFVIATRQHALGIIVHDAVHYRLFRNIRLNDAVSNIFCAYPLGAATSLYRSFHLDHHRYTNTAMDPEVKLLHVQSDWQFPKTKIQIFKIFLGDLTGLNLIKAIDMAKTISPAVNFFKTPHEGGISDSERWGYGAFLGLFVVIMSVFDLWMYYVLFWLLPAGVTASIFRLRMMAEHFGVPNDSEIRGTRSFSAGLIERMIIAPLNVGYHLEHHMFPSVPWFNQRKLRQLLLNEADYASKAHMTQSYLGFKNSVLSELTQNGKA